MTMSVWEQRTSQLRRQRQMSSREILYSSPSEEKDGPPASAQGQPGHALSQCRKASQRTPSSSLKRLEDPPPPTAEMQTSASPIHTDMPLDTGLSGSIPEPPLSVLVPESLDPTSMSVPDPPVSILEPSESDSTSDGGKLGVNQSHNPLSEHRSPRLNGERRHRAVKKFRPPDNSDTLATPEAGGHRGIRGRRALHRCEPQTEGSSPGDGSHLASRSASRERGRNAGEAEDKEAGTEKEAEVCQPEESR